MKLFVPLLAAVLGLTGCTASAPLASTPPAEPSDGLSRARIGETVTVGGPKVTPLAVLEDSRCPLNVRCVWAGQVRISARIDLGSGSQTLELTQGKTVPIADGTLELVEALPDKPAPGSKPVLAPKDYRFGFRFMGGL